MNVYHLKQWLVMAESEEKARTKGKEGYKECSNTWRRFVRLVQFVWKTGDILQQMQRVVVVLFQKGNNNNLGN